MYIIDAQKLRTHIKTKGYNSILELTNYLGMHRNTLHKYLSGQNIIPRKLETIFETLNLDIRDFIIHKKNQKKPSFEDIAVFIDQLTNNFPDITIVLFGSRSTENHSKYSDWDFGVYSTNGISHKEFIKIRLFCKNIEESLPYNLDIANLNKADDKFLTNIAPNLTFMGGKRKGWIKLLQEIV